MLKFLAPLTFALLASYHFYLGQVHSLAGSSSAAIGVFTEAHDRVLKTFLVTRNLKGEQIRIAIPLDEVAADHERREAAILPTEANLAQLTELLYGQLWFIHKDYKMVSKGQGIELHLNEFKSSVPLAIIDSISVATYAVVLSADKKELVLKRLNELEKKFR